MASLDDHAGGEEGLGVGVNDSALNHNLNLLLNRFAEARPD
jgi:hypothetical protein